MSIRSLRAIPYHPVCANKEREYFLSGAATPPNLGGEFGLTFRYMTYLWAKRELEDIRCFAIDQEFGKMSKLHERGLQPGVHSTRKAEFF